MLLSNIRGLLPASNLLGKLLIRNSLALYSSTSSVATPVNKEPKQDKLFRSVEIEVRGHDKAVLKSYLEFLKNTIAHLELRRTEVRTLPYIRWIQWALRAKFAKKKYKLHYETRTHISQITVLDVTGSTASTFLEYIQRNIPEGPGIKKEPAVKMQETDTVHLVFVYGTLKSGEPNAPVMTDDSTGTCKFIGKAQTLTKFPLIIGSIYNIPFLLNLPHKGHLVEGEVYGIDSKKLSFLDEFEAHPQFYRRERLPVKLIDGAGSTTDRTMDVWIYLLPTWRDQLYDENTTVYSCYSSGGAHGRVYVSNEDCECLDDLFR
uniref:Gamma-glutamylcyclotransferase family protein n=1 Tax=Ditylenchus dipsaci TaxID=166011 RepID=A0A915EH38_9BILA